MNQAQFDKELARLKELRSKEYANSDEWWSLDTDIDELIEEGVTE